jgi:hypothetical protein
MRPGSSGRTSPWAHQTGTEPRRRVPRSIIGAPSGGARVIPLIGIAVILVLLAGPLLLALAGFTRSRRTPQDAAPIRAVPWNWKLTVASALAYTLAFNVIFFTQELFLVLPKALAPGLRPTLFHNNHQWAGDNPLAALLQGTGALATFLTGIVCAVLLRRGPQRSSTRWLFLIWMTYNGFLQSLPQVIIGALVPQNDVGMAMEYLHLGAAAKTTAALVALAAIPLVGLRLTGPLLSLARDPIASAGPGARTRFIFQVATLPALTAILLIIPFRVPRNWIEVVMVPVVVTVIGITWIQAGAWRVSKAKAEPRLNEGSIAYALGAVVLLLLVFQLLLRPGIQFY